MNSSMKRTVIITGAAQGIGYALAEAFVENGDFVAIADLKGAENAAIKLGKNSKGYTMNVADEESVSAFIEKVVEERQSIDVLINNAGLQHIDRIENYPLEKWQLLISVMLTGPFLMTKHVLPSMKKQGSGRIINISSAHGKMGTPYKSAYVSAKHGLVGLSRTVALETANEGITVNTIMPGPVQTDMIMNQVGDLAKQEGITEDEAIQKYILGKQPLKRFVELNEISQTAIFLTSDSAAAITGEEISVSGGM